MKTNIVINISSPIPYIAKFWFSSYGPKWSQPIKLQYSLKCYISTKKCTMTFIFGMQINIELFTKPILSNRVCVTRMPKVPKIKSLHIFGISPEKHGG